MQPEPEVARAEIQAALAARTYDVVVVGAGIRNPPPKLFLFETVVNTIHGGAPNARIAFNTRPDDSDAAALLVGGTGRPSADRRFPPRSSGSEPHPLHR
ncbi:hypothetical protein ACRAWD_06635 [Caulobacter segnis]